MDEATLRRLGEIGIDVYMPRRAADATAPAVADRAAAGARGIEPAAPAAAIDVVLIANVAAARAVALTSAVERALGFARVACRRIEAAEESGLADARALVAFGDVHARAAGRVLSAQRQQQMAWVVTGEPTALGADPHAKRALWSELKRVARQLRRPDGR